VTAALKILGASFRDVWQELWTILIIQVLFLVGTILIVSAPPVMLALFFYGNQVAHGERVTEREFLQAIRRYWKPAWRWGLINLLAIGVLTGDYYLIGKMAANPNQAYWIQGFYLTVLAAWFLLQLFTLPFLFEQEQPSVRQALRNAAVFIGRNLILVLVLALLLVISLAAGMLVFMLTLVFGGALIAFAGNHAVLEHLTDR
jgi:uncharacterized membrane protein YesL